MELAELNEKTSRMMTKEEERGNIYPLENFRIMKIFINLTTLVVDC